MLAAVTEYDARITENDIYDALQRMTYMVYDEKGGKEKSKLDDWIHYHDLGMCVPSTMMTAEVVMQFVCSNMGKVAPKSIIVDIPRMYTSGAKLCTSINKGWHGV